LFFSIKRNIKLNSEQLKRIVNKLLDIHEIKWNSNQIPSLIHNILYFTSSKDNRLFIYENILLFFNNIKNSQLKILSSKSTTPKKATTSTQINKVDMIDCETLSIMHIIHSIKTDRSSAKDLIKLLKLKLTKNVKELIHPFTYALIISLIKVLPKQDCIIDILKNAIMKIFEAELKHKKYQWVMKCFNEEEKNLILTLDKPSKAKYLIIPSYSKHLLYTHAHSYSFLISVEWFFKRSWTKLGFG
jgi:hypothetical protein